MQIENYCWKLAKIGKSFQLLPHMAKLVKRCQMLPKVVKSCQKFPIVVNLTRCHDDINDDMMTRWNYDMKHNDENYQQFCWKIIIIQCNLPPPNYGRPLHPKSAPTRMTYIPSSMIKMTTDFVEKSSLSSVTYHHQIMVVHCTQNWHLLVWPIHQAHWWKWPTILLKNLHYPV